MNIQTPRIFIVKNGKRVIPLDLLPAKNYNDKILMDAFTVLQKNEIRSHYENEGRNGTITISNQDDVVFIECVGLSEKATQFLTSLFEPKR